MKLQNNKYTFKIYMFLDLKGIHPQYIYLTILF